MAQLDSQQSLNQKNSVFNTKNGRYVLGGFTEVSTQMLEWWSKSQVIGDPTDIVYFMERKYEGRPDMVGYVFYGDPGLWWIVAQYNNILDPFTELVEGKILIIPTLSRIKQAYTQNAHVGGKPTTRKKK